MKYQTRKYRRKYLSAKQVCAYICLYNEKFPSNNKRASDIFLLIENWFFTNWKYKMIEKSVSQYPGSQFLAYLKDYWTSYDFDKPMHEINATKFQLKFLSTALYLRTVDGYWLSRKLLKFSASIIGWYIMNSIFIFSNTWNWNPAFTLLLMKMKIIFSVSIAMIINSCRAVVNLFLLLLPIRSIQLKRLFLSLKQTFSQILQSM